MFDFLSEDDEGAPRRKKIAATPTERPFPIIRKPVPVSESGPLLPPKPGAPIEPPPALTSGSDDQVVDDLGFLDDTPPRRNPGTRQGANGGSEETRTNVTRLDSVSRRRGTPPPDEFGLDDAEVGSIRPARKKDGFENAFDKLDLDDSLELDEDWQSGLGVRSVDEEQSSGRSGRGRWLAMVLALLFIAAGVGSFILSSPPAWLPLPGKDSNPVIAMPSDTQLPESTLGSTVEAIAPSPLMQKFLDEKTRVEELVAAGALDEAEAALQNMDRSVYGYGSPEFSAIQDQIDQLRSGSISAEQFAAQNREAEAARLAEEQAALAEAARLADERAAREEAARLAAEQAARAEAARVAEEQAARAEAARAAEEQSAREEAARLAAEQAARAESARLAEQQAARAEAARLAEEQRVREEAARQAELQAARDEAARIEQVRQAEQAARLEAERLEQTRSQTQSSVPSPGPSAQSIDRDRIATDRRIAEERAALQRQQAREQRLIEARQREAQAEEARSLAQSGAGNESNSGSQSPGEADAVISDADLQLVYQRFVNLQRAISERDINAVVSLTKRSGVRVQQFMQIFENSTEIDARIKNVSTSNATGEIKGTLQINRIRRADGSYVQPPASLASIDLSSNRDEYGWSAISW